ncbi:non-canonical purine NTP pyrophosphatase [Bacteroidota bacterium]|nr:non-canonical purine NTP pyrophosphatase [Bacteroidota bacterium]
MFKFHPLKKLLFATQNKNKLKEAVEILRDKYDVSSPPALENEEELPEDFFTLHENACQKASFVAEKFNLNCFAEDTGLEVYALDLKPGVFSARFAGPERDDEANKKKLLQLLEGITDRRARFRTVIALYENGKVTYFEGTLEGEISLAPLGNCGFGYDAIFKPNGSQWTLGEMEESQKNKISHRKQALSSLVKYLSDSFEN